MSDEELISSELLEPPLGQMFKNWFLDYASYVILERAVPALADGLKPVQRRILHSIKEMDDGRYNKVANIIGNTMKYHPHGDASIGDALVQLGQKDLLIDMQGNWGNILTGDAAAAPRYIEARLSKFAKEVVFNPKITEYIKSYDGRNDEPVHLPVKFPLLLAQGAEGIAVGMACKILPHNFNEIIDAAIHYLKNEDFVLYPDFLTGGQIDITHYNEGLRGGKIRIRAKIRKEDKGDLIIEEIPFGVTTSSLIESILKANDKGQIKIKKIEDNTAENAEILIQLAPGVSPDKTIDALYAFTDCEVSISPNAAVIDNDKPAFLGVHDLLRASVDHTVNCLRLELEIELKELLEQFYFLSLEQLFIQEKIYIAFDGKTYEEAKTLTFEALQPYFPQFYREVNTQDIEKLLEIRMRRITQNDAGAAQIQLENLQEKMEKVRHHLANLIDFSIDYFKQLKKNHGKGKERKTEIKIFDAIAARSVMAHNRKLYAQLEEGFIGYNLKKGEFIADCSDLDDILVVLQDGSLMITPISEKKFVGKNHENPVPIVFVAVFKKNEADRKVYHLIYQDGEKGSPIGKRFMVKAMTRDKIYDLTKGTPGTKVLYFSALPNGEREILTVEMQPIGGLKQVQFDFDFTKIPIKSMTSVGQKLTHRVIKGVRQKEIGASTLSARSLWYDPQTKRLNLESKGDLLGEFSTEDKLFYLTKNGAYQFIQPELSYHFPEDLLHIQKFEPQKNKELLLVYFEAERSHYYVKRFALELMDKKIQAIGENPQSYVLFFSLETVEKIKITLMNPIKGGAALTQVLTYSEIPEVKTIQALGKDLGTGKITKVS